YETVFPPSIGKNACARFLLCARALICPDHAEHRRARIPRSHEIQVSVSKACGKDPGEKKVRVTNWFTGTNRGAKHLIGQHCQSACKFDPVSAFNFDPFARRGLRVALDSSELAGIAETRRARVA